MDRTSRVSRLRLPQRVWQYASLIHLCFAILVDPSSKSGLVLRSHPQTDPLCQDSDLSDLHQNVMPPTVENYPVWRSVATRNQAGSRGGFVASRYRSFRSLVCRPFPRFQIAFIQPPANVHMQISPGTVWDAIPSSPVDTTIISLAEYRPSTRFASWHPPRLLWCVQSSYPCSFLSNVFVF